MAETSTIFGFMKYVSATDILSDFKKTVDSHFVNSLKGKLAYPFYMCYYLLGSVMSCQRDMQSVVNSAKEKWIREYR